MAQAPRDQNRIPTLLGVSSADGITPVAVYVDPTTHRLYVDIPGGSGSVSTVSVTSANGFAGTVLNPTSTPAITISTTITGTLVGNGTAISASKLALTQPATGSTLTVADGKTLTANQTFTINGGDAAILAIAAAKTLTVSNSLTLAGTDATTMTFPTTSATIARTDAANTFTGTQTIGALVATTLNGNTFTTGTYTLTGQAGKTLTFNGTITLTGTDAQTYTFPTTSATLARTDAANTFTGVQTMTSPSITTSIVTGSASFDAFNTTATTLNIGGAATTLAIGGTPTTAITHNYSTNATANATTKTINFGTGGAAGSTTNVNIGSSNGGTTTINSGTISLGSTTGVTTTGSIELGAASDTTLSRSAAGVLAVEGVVIPSISSTNTLTNKYITPQVQSVGDAGGTFTPVSITNDMGVMTALTQATTIAAPSGSPVQGERLVIRIKDNGTARALTWNAIYRASSDLALPSTTILSKTLYCGFMYNSTDSKWDLLAVLNNF